jgi:Tol biopolymer transport system component
MAPASTLNSGQAQQLTSGAGLCGFSWAPDGQIVLCQDWSLSLLNPESRNKTPLTTPQDGIAYEPGECANGRYIIFGLAGHGVNTGGLWRIDATGGNLKQLVSGGVNYSTTCSSDGNWVYYIDPSQKLMKVPIDGGQAELVKEPPVFSVFGLSSDGKWAIFRSLSSPTSTIEVLELVPLDSPQNTKLLPLQRPAMGPTRFTNDGKAVVYPIRENDAFNLWLQPLDGSAGRQLTNFKSEHIIDFRWSFDGSKLALFRGHSDSDVVLIRDTEK